MELYNLINANCTNCEYVNYSHTDGIRLERCKVFHKKDKFKSLPINTEARESILNGAKDLCEKYSPALDLIMDGKSFVYDVVP